MRNAVGADDLQTARLPAEQIEGRAQGPYEKVVLVTRERLAALARDVDVQPGVGHPDDDVVIEPQRQTEGVEARAEVGAGGGDAHPDSGGAEGWTGHRSMTLLELRDCRRHSMTYEEPRGLLPASRTDASDAAVGPRRRRGTVPVGGICGRRVQYSLSKEGSVAT